MKQTKIICTIGPSSSDYETLKRMADAGMNIARINLSHGSDEARNTILGNIRKLNTELPCPIGILFDTKGAEIRTGVVQYPLLVQKGEEVIFAPQPIPGGQKTIEVNYSRFYSDVQETNVLLIDGGEVSFDIVEIRADGSVVGCAQHDGEIGSRRHITLPGADIDLPSITEEDWQQIEFAADNDVDFIALSFIRCAEEVQDVKKFLREKGNTTLKIVTKVETRQAMENLGEIIEESDAVMVARGDLGSDFPYEVLPALQDEITTRCRDAKVPVIVATHMLESMITHPVPTRAEVIDVAYAAKSEVDATMLSGETAVGKYPVEAVDAMARVLRETEEHARRFSHDEQPVHDTQDDASHDMIAVARKQHAAAIVVSVQTFEELVSLSAQHAEIHTVALTDRQSLQRLGQLLYGVSTLQGTSLDDVRSSHCIPAGTRVFSALDKTIHTL